ncbi:hypothetical protein GH714_037106 [Hevea brasiliensis]|uniref:Uncharacterized protein n=1 Tax=Hevea brasiliensis TaxID=3981 RepID=A0A6A6MR40_HEVBR|nr:hypothetical protein GH714_037106 [Hevea brasiliensis]
MAPNLLPDASHSNINCFWKSSMANTGEDVIAYWRASKANCASADQANDEILSFLSNCVDSRMLKAVAIENPKDVNGAAEVIISEVLPFLSQQSMVDSPLHKDCSPSGLSGGRVVNDEQNNRTVTTSLESKSIAKEDACKTDLTSAIHHSGSTHQEKALNPPTLLSCGTNVDTNQFPGSSTNQLQRNIESEELILLLRSQHQDNVPSDLNIEREESILLMGSQHQEENSKQDIKIDFLEDVIEAAKNNKKTLFLAMESIMNMMRQVELQEKIAELAKEEAASAGLDILTKVKELKQMLEPAKEANDMHAGEIYGEKAILATEARELQARLISLSEERDKALAILDEMQQTLEARLDAAEELRRTAEEQKLKKKNLHEMLLLNKRPSWRRWCRSPSSFSRRQRKILRGEISVICQDVRLLKERFDERVH